MAAARSTTISNRSLHYGSPRGTLLCPEHSQTALLAGHHALISRKRGCVHARKAKQLLRREAQELQGGWCKRAGRTVSCSASAEPFTSPKFGAVGADRFKSDAAPGTYWGPSQTLGEEVTLRLDTGTEVIDATARTGENLLRVAEAAGAMTPDQDFCFEGTCSKCEMEVEGGAAEVGYRAEPGALEVVRSCICPVPGGRSQRTVKMLNEEDVWGDGVL